MYHPTGFPVSTELTRSGELFGIYLWSMNCQHDIKALHFGSTIYAHGVFWITLGSSFSDYYILNSKNYRVYKLNEMSLVRLIKKSAFSISRHPPGFSLTPTRSQVFAIAGISHAGIFAPATVGSDAFDEVVSGKIFSFARFFATMDKVLPIQKTYFDALSKIHPGTKHFRYRLSAGRTFNDYCLAAGGLFALLGKEKLKKAINGLSVRVVESLGGRASHTSAQNLEPAKFLSDHIHLAGAAPLLKLKQATDLVRPVLTVIEGGASAESYLGVLSKLEIFAKRITSVGGLLIATKTGSGADLYPVGSTPPEIDPEQSLASHKNKDLWAGAQNKNKTREKERFECDWMDCKSHDTDINPIYPRDGEPCDKSTTYSKKWVKAGLEPWVLRGHTGRDIKSKVTWDMYWALGKGIGKKPKSAVVRDDWELVQKDLYSTQKHHLISVHLMPSYEKLSHNAKLVGYNINSKENGICLPYYQMDMVKHDLPAHRGSHAEEYYDKHVKKYLEELELEIISYCASGKQFSIQEKFIVT